MEEQVPTPGSAFHRLLPHSRGTWAPLAAVIVMGGTSLLVMSLASAILVLTGARLIGYSDFTINPRNGVNAGEMLAANLGLALLIPVAAGLMSGLYLVRPAWLVSNRPGMRWSWLARCVGVSAVVWSVFLVLGTAGALATRDAPVDASVVGFLIVVIVTTPLQAAGEEFLFRGVLLQALGATRLTTWGCCLADGFLFAAAHGQFDPPLFADRLLLGSALAWLAIQTGGIEAGLAIHAVKNVSVLVPAGLLDDVSSALDPSGVTWIPFAVDAVLLSIVMGWIVVLARRRGLNPAPEPATPDWPPMEPW